MAGLACDCRGRALSSPTTCRFIPAHSELPYFVAWNRRSHFEISGDLRNRNLRFVNCNRVAGPTRFAPLVRADSHPNTRTQDCRQDQIDGQDTWTRVYTGCGSGEVRLGLKQSVLVIENAD